MKMATRATLAPDPATAAAAATPVEVFQQIGTITRLLHDTLQQLGVMPMLQQAADDIPDARSRLSYIATKTAAAADKVLTLVDQAKAARWSTPRAAPMSSAARARSMSCWPASAFEPARRPAGAARPRPADHFFCTGTWLRRRLPARARRGLMCCPEMARFAPAIAALGTGSALLPWLVPLP